MKDSQGNEKGTSSENARTEYAATNDAYMHYDNFSWQVGAVLIAGVFVYWGFLITSTSLKLTVGLVGNMLVCALMSIWLLYTEHNRQIYLFKLHRIHELEEQLEMFQHRRFKEWGQKEPKKYSLNRPVGRYLDDAIYVIASLGGILPVWLGSQANQWTSTDYTLVIVTFVAVLVIIVRTHRVDYKTKKMIGELEKKRSEKDAKSYGSSTELISTSTTIESSVPHEETPMKK
jgi:hypothetical protein